MIVCQEKIGIFAVCKCSCMDELVRHDCKFLKTVTQLKVIFEIMLSCIPGELCKLCHAAYMEIPVNNVKLYIWRSL